MCIINEQSNAWAIPQELWEHVLELAWQDEFTRRGMGSVVEFAIELASESCAVPRSKVGATVLLRPVAAFRMLQAGKAGKALVAAGAQPELFARLMALTRGCLVVWDGQCEPRESPYCICRASFEAVYRLAYKATVGGAGLELREASLACALIVLEKGHLTASERTKRCARIADAVLFNENVWARAHGFISLQTKITDAKRALEKGE